MKKLNQMKQLEKEEWDRQLIDFINKNPIPEEPIIPLEITFPFMMVYYRKKLSLRNHNYLLAVAIFSIADYASSKRSIVHKGWATPTLMFDLPEFMKDDHLNNRYIYYKFHDWNSIEHILSVQDKLLIPNMEELFPCNKLVKLREKNGQYKFII